MIGSRRPQWHAPSPLIIFFLIATAGAVFLLLYVAESLSVPVKAGVLGASFTAVGVALVSMSGRPPHYLSLYALFTYAHVVLFVGRPLYNGLMQGGRDPFFGVVHGGALVSAAVVAGAGFLSMSCGYMLARGLVRFPPRAAVWPMREAWFRARAWVYLTLVAGVALYSLYVRQVGGIGALVRLSSGRSAELTAALAQSSGYFTSGLLFTLGVSVFVLAQALATKNVGLACVGVVGVLVGTAPQILSGSRSVFLPVVVALFFCVVRLRPEWVRARVVLPALPVAFVGLFILPRVLRHAQHGGNVLHAIGRSFSPEEVWGGFFGGLDTAMIDAFAHQIEAQGAGTIDLLGGSTYLGGVLAFIPRAIWPGKPEAVDTILNQYIFPFTAQKQIGFSFGVYSEPYLNFGLLGVIGVLALLGLVFALVDVRAFASASTLQLALMALFAGVVVPLVRGSISFDLQRFLIPALPLMLLYFVVRGPLRRDHPAHAATPDPPSRFLTEATPRGPARPRAFR